MRDAIEHEPSLRRRLAASDTGRAAGLAAALMANNFVALIFTIVFARLLGDDGYGSLGALIAAFTILIVPGSALQATVAREVSAHAAEGEANPAAGVWRWLERLAVLTVGITAASVLLREQIAAAVGVEQAWAAAALLPSGMLWLALCVQRGTLQGLGRYRAVGWSIVGEAGARLGMGLALYAAGLGRHGAFPRQHALDLPRVGRAGAAAGGFARPLADALGPAELPRGALQRLGPGAGLLAHRGAAEHRHRLRQARPVRRRRGLLRGGLGSGQGRDLGGDRTRPLSAAGGRAADPCREGRPSDAVADAGSDQRRRRADGAGLHGRGRAGASASCSARTSRTPRARCRCSRSPCRCCRRPTSASSTCWHSAAARSSACSPSPLWPSLRCWWRLGSGLVEVAAVLVALQLLLAPALLTMSVRTAAPHPVRPSAVA